MEKRCTRNVAVARAVSGENIVAALFMRTATNVQSHNKSKACLVPIVGYLAGRGCQCDTSCRRALKKSRVDVSVVKEGYQCLQINNDDEESCQEIPHSCYCNDLHIGNDE
jgi:hypothetical protein